MEALPLLPNGQLARKTLARFGGAYSLLKAWRLGGTGSGKLVYAGGLPHFDEQLRGGEGELAMMVMEVLEGGLLLWLNASQRVACVGVRLEDLREAHLERQSGTFTYYDRLEGRRKEVTYQHGLLYLRGEGFDVRAVVITREYHGLMKFFEKRPLAWCFRVTDVSAEERRDYSEDLAAVIRLIEAIQ